jgi:DNA-binding response OmpR family regulator
MMEGIQILVIDDEPAILKMITMALSSKGYQVDTADGDEKCLEKLQSNEYHLVVTDMNIGKMSGYDVLKKVRELKGEDIPVVAMSGEYCLVNGLQFDAFILKPCSLKLLAETIQNCLSFRANS